MPSHVPLIDIIVLVVYLAAVVGLGCWFAWRTKSADEFMAAGRSLPGWAVGLSIFGSYVSSISFLANPGKAFDGNWNVFVFALSLPPAAWISVRFFVPFYRRTGEVSAYEHLEARFGPWARTYGVVCYLLTQLARLGTILYLLALALQPLVGFDVRTIIVLSGIVVTIYPLFGGTEGVIWTGVVQAIVLVLGAVVCVVLLLFGVQGGPGELVAVAAAHDKFSLGSVGPGIAQSTFWVVLLNGMVTNLQNFGIDQSYVQRYITAKTDRDASRSVWLGALCYIPLSAAFLFIGTALFVFYQQRPELLPAGVHGDKVFPQFIGTQLPPGLMGLVLAAICSAAMDSNLNCCATLYLCDIHRRYLRPRATDRESMFVLHASTLVMGALSTITALAMIQVKTALDIWWKLAGICSGGMLGLFLLCLFVHRVRSHHAAWAVLSGVAVIGWMTFSPIYATTLKDRGIAWLISPFHDNLIIVVGTVTIFAAGVIASGFPHTKGSIVSVSPVRESGGGN
jgi:solute:Na+ symporter, SSS family